MDFRYLLIVATSALFGIFAFTAAKESMAGAVVAVIGVLIFAVVVYRLSAPR